MLFASVPQARHTLATVWRWSNFDPVELACNCAGRFCAGAYWHDPAFLDALQRIRDDLGQPLIINSGHRCPQWNAIIGGAPFSQHKTVAADIALHGHERHDLLAAARRAGFTGFGLARTFLHLDRRARPAQWFYPGSKALWQI